MFMYTFMYIFMYVFVYECVYVYVYVSNQSLMFFEETTKWVDDGSPVDVVYFIFQKAFDKVPHQRLLLKLKPHGIGNDVINWIEKWLTHKRQRVTVDGEISNWKSDLSGVRIFADDTNIFRKITNNTDKQNLQDDLDKLVK